LRGIGASLALPWLEARTPDKFPVRMAVLYMPNGVREDAWTPQGEGRQFTLAPAMAPLEDLKSQLTICTNLWNAASKGGDGHYVKASGFLTSTTITKTLGVDINCNGVSMDQVAAKAAGDRTPLPSLELGTAPETTGVDTNVGYTRVYGSHVSWSGPTSPLAKELDPRAVWERLFRAANPRPGSDKDEILLLDSVREDAKQLSRDLGTADKQRLDEYLSAVRDVEVRLERARRPRQTRWKAAARLDPAAKPEPNPKHHPDHVRLMLDMIALAFQSDTTRIATFMFSNAVSNENFSFLDGVSGAHHSISHHQNDPDKLRQYLLINRWHMEQYAYLLRKLQGMKEGEGNVLDHAMIAFGAGMRDGNKHDPHNLPVVVAGRAGGRISAGQHIIVGKDSPLSNLWLTLLDAFGTPVERFADSTGKLTPILKT